MDAQDEQDTSGLPEPTESEAAPTLIAASGLGVDGEHGPLFSGIDLDLPRDFMPFKCPAGRVRQLCC